MKTISRILGVALLPIVAAGCQGGDEELAVGANQVKTLSTEPMPNRWYSEAQFVNGKTLFLNHCASCHKADASGTKDWKTADTNGKYPPPPLNGTAHTWHHSMDVFRRTIRRGGIELGGVMPGFTDLLSSGEIDEVIAYFQSTWAEGTYSNWLKRTQ